MFEFNLKSQIIRKIRTEFKLNIYVANILQVCKIQLATPKDVEGLVTLQPGDLRQLSPVDMMQVLS